jgi:dinuclear metal center YbgI/SA1388 family protein
MPTIRTITAFLDKELRIADYQDSSHNGLQVGGAGRVARVCCGVDASLAFFEEAQKRGADLVVCHHGISWGDSLARITDLNYRRVAYLVRHDMALYACHLPLDAHPRHGNNILLARALGIQRPRRFGMYNGMEIGFAGALARPVSYARFKQRVARVTGGALQTMDFGRKTVRRVAVVSGGGAAEAAEAGRKGIDVYVSGEAGLVAYSLAQEYGINAVFAGHYATERFGVRALGELLAKRFKIQAEFIDLNVPF